MDPSHIAEWAADINILTPTARGSDKGKLGNLLDLVVELPVRSRRADRDSGFRIPLKRSASDNGKIHRSIFQASKRQRHSQNLVLHREPEATVTEAESHDACEPVWMDIKTSLPDRELYVEKSMCVNRGNLGTDTIVGMVISIMGEDR